MQLRATLLLLLPRLLVSAFTPTVACGFSPTPAPVQCRVGQQGIASRGLATAATTMAEGGRYRACAGCAIFNRQGLFLVGERVGGKPDQWQFPQGGVDDGETPLEAAKRETYEEIGLKTPDVISESCPRALTPYFNACNAAGYPSKTLSRPYGVPASVEVKTLDEPMKYDVSGGWLQQKGFSMSHP